MGSTQSKTSKPSVAVEPPLPPKVEPPTPKSKDNFNMYSMSNQRNQIVIYGVYGLKQEPLIVSKNIDEIIAQYKCSIEITIKRNPLVLYIEFFQCDLEDSKGLGRILFCKIIQRLYNMIGKPKDPKFNGTLDLLDANTTVMLTAVASAFKKQTDITLDMKNKEIKEKLLPDQIKLENYYIQMYGFQQSDKDRKGNVRRNYFPAIDDFTAQLHTLMHTTLGTIHEKCYPSGGNRNRTLRKKSLR